MVTISKEKLKIIQAKEAKKGNVVSIVNGRLKVALKCEDETMTQQQYKQKQDIKEIIKKYNATGLLNKNIMSEPMFDDVSEIGDYQDAQAKIIKASQAFDQLPSIVKDKFDHNPAKLLDYLNKSENMDEAIELGLVNKSVTPEKSNTEVLLEEIVKNTQKSSSSVE